MYDSQNIPVALSRIQNEQIYNKENRTGFYRAVVVQNTDPLNIARVRVRIPAFHGANPSSTYYIQDEELPFAYPATYNGAGYKTGQYLIPMVGSLVWVSFETGTDNLVYFGGVYTADPSGNRYLQFDRSTNNGDKIQIVEDDLSKNNDPNRYVLFKTLKGAEIVIDDRDKNESIEIKDAHGNQIIMNSKGIRIKTTGEIEADFPHIKTYYTDVANVSDSPVFDIGYDKVFPTKEMDYYTTPSVGGKVLYMSEGKVVGSGFVTEILLSGRIMISTNGAIVK